MHFYAWKRGLKTGMYYLRTQPKAKAIQFTVDQAAITSSNKEEIEKQKKNVEISKKENMKAAANNVGDLLPDTKNLTVQDDSEICLSCGA